MREFDDFEKEIIRRLKEYKEDGLTVNFLSLLQIFLKNRGVEIKKSTTEGWINFDVKKFAYYDAGIDTWISRSSLVPEVTNATEIIIKLIFLLDYLESKGLIFLYDFTKNDSDAESFPQDGLVPWPIRVPIAEKKVVELLIGFFHKEIVISQSIVTLVNNDFLTRKEVQHLETIQYANRSLLTGERSIIMANRATGASIVLGLVSVVLSLYSIQQTREQMKVVVKRSANGSVKKERPENDFIQLVDSISVVTQDSDSIHGGK